MIKVMLVEDDKLVRNSMITSFDWEKYNMKIIADAKNGEKALEVLEIQEVELIITDLAMPIMSGIELIRKVRIQYPHIFIVVLSLHQDFEYIQEAMRLGAIDYIAKVELDTDHMDQTLDRIHKRITDETQKQKSHQQMLSDHIGNGVIIVSRENIEKNSNIINVDSHNKKWMFIDTTSLLIITETAEQIDDIVQALEDQTKSGDPLLVITIENNSTLQKEEMINTVQRYKEDFYFYEIQKNKIIHVTNIEKLKIPQTDKDVSQDKMKQITEQLQSLTWVFDELLLENIMKEISSWYLTKYKLKEFLVVSIGKSQHLYYFSLIDKIDFSVSFSTWEDVKRWFYNARKEIYRSIHSKSTSDEVKANIFHAVYLIENNLSTNITTTGIAKKVHMSRSYFCVCFKDVIGKTFNEYIQSARISKAIYFLIYTNKTITSISEEIGYTDAKYFSKIFRRITGLLPSDYRKENQSI